MIDDARMAEGYTGPGPADAADRANDYDAPDPDGDPLAGIPDDILAMAGIVR